MRHDIGGLNSEEKFGELAKYFYFQIFYFCAIIYRDSLKIEWQV